MAQEISLLRISLKNKESYFRYQTLSTETGDVRTPTKFFFFKRPQRGRIISTVVVSGSDSQLAD